MKVYKKGSKEYKDAIAEVEAKNYKTLRKEAYPSMVEQLDMQYHDKVNGTNKWFELIESIKTSYPKED